MRVTPDPLTQEICVYLKVGEAKFMLTQEGADAYGELFLPPAPHGIKLNEILRAAGIYFQDSYDIDKARKILSDKVMGAGYIGYKSGRTLQATWDSTDCRSYLGRDKPEDPAFADQLLANLVSEVSRMYRSFMEQL